MCCRGLRTSGEHVRCCGDLTLGNCVEGSHAFRVGPRNIRDECRVAAQDRSPPLWLSASTRGECVLCMKDAPLAGRAVPADICLNVCGRGASAPLVTLR